MNSFCGHVGPFMAGKRRPRAVEPVPTRQDTAVAPTRVAIARTDAQAETAVEGHRGNCCDRSGHRSLLWLSAVSGKPAGENSPPAIRRASVRGGTRALARWLAARPNSGKAHYYRAYSALTVDNPPEAIAAIERSRSLGFDRERLDCLTAIYQAHHSRYALAESALEAAYRQGIPPRAEVAKELARIYLSTYRLAQAAEDSLNHGGPSNPAIPSPICGPMKSQRGLTSIHRF